MEENGEELEPLFDYSRVQPRNVVCLDDNDSDSPSDSPRKRRKISKSAVVANVEKVDESVKVVAVDAEEEDWLLPPPKVPIDAKPRGEDSTLRELRLKKQELASLAQSADNVLRAVEESAKRELSQSLESALEAAVEQPSKPQLERKKIVISIQDKDGVKQFRIYMDDNFERLFKMYADKVKLGLQSLVFSFDGDKIGPAATPDALGMEDNDIIEVRATSS